MFISPSTRRLLSNFFLCGGFDLLAEGARGYRRLQIDLLLDTAGGCRPEEEGQEAGLVHQGYDNPELLRVCLLGECSCCLQEMKSTQTAVKC